MSDTCQHDPMFTFDGRCLKCHPPKRILAVQHIDGTPEFAPLRWNPKTREMESLSATRWSTDAERETWRQEGASETQAAAEKKMVDYNFAGCAGNSADEYDSSTEGHW